MKLCKKIIIALGILCSILCVTHLVYATEIDDLNLNIIPGVNITDPVGEQNSENDIMLINNVEDPFQELPVLNDDKYCVFQEIRISENINGNVYILAQKADLEDTSIDGNLFIMGQDVTIKNTYVSGSVYIMAQNLVLDAEIRDAYIMAQSINMQEHASIARNLRAMGETFNISGNIAGNCYVAGNNITVDNNATIGGTLEYTSSKEATIANPASIGEVKMHIEEVEVEEQEDSKTEGIVYDLIASFIKVAIIAGLLIILSSRIVQNKHKITVGDFFKNVGIGLLAVIIIPIVAILFIISIFGIGIGVLLFALYVLLFYISLIITSLVIANHVVKSDSKWYLFGFTILAYFIIKVLTYVPILGSFVTIFAGLAGIGYVISNIFGKKKEKTEVKEENIEKTENNNQE